MTYNFQPASGPVGSFNPDNLLAGYSVPAITESVVIASGAGALARGTLLGKVTASGKYVVSTSAASDGSQNPVAVLAEDIDATDADVTTVGYLSGEFNTAAMTFGPGHTAASVKAALRDLNIYLFTNLPA
ncbi:MAG: head decoration protein [Sulfitobacter sp.]|uniref:head decoration protein n=1 Tax=Sphingomonas sp. TaxID=28214 RepID=UPI002583CAC4|nr:head decoration protein [Sphingomonas sp.]MCP3878513.1 head decoration protein [Sulfitobacter sp.]MCP4025110.1 head decoration protein [Sphingomonas sp.]